MKMTMYFVVENGVIRNFMTDSEKELEKARLRYEHIFMTRDEAVEFIKNPPKKEKHLSEDEAKEMEIAQFKFYLEMENIQGKEREKKWDKFWDRYNRIHWKDNQQRRMAYGRN